MKRFIQFFRSIVGDRAVEAIQKVNSKRDFLVEQSGYREVSIFAIESGYRYHRLLLRIKELDDIALLALRTANAQRFTGDVKKFRSTYQKANQIRTWYIGVDKCRYRLEILVKNILTNNEKLEVTIDFDVSAPTINKVFPLLVHYLTTSQVSKIPHDWVMNTDWYSFLLSQDMLQVFKDALSKEPDLLVVAKLRTYSQTALFLLNQELLAYWKSKNEIQYDTLKPSIVSIDSKIKSLPLNDIIHCVLDLDKNER